MATRSGKLLLELYFYKFKRFILVISTLRLNKFTKIYFQKVSQFWIARQYQKAWSSRSTDFKSSASVSSSRPSSCNTSACTTPTPFIGLPPSRPNSTRPSSAYASKLSPSTSIRSYSSRSTVSTSGSTMSSMRF